MLYETILIVKRMKSLYATISTSFRKIFYEQIKNFLVTVVTVVTVVTEQKTFN